jgi:nitrite reductase (NADH) small subunit
VGRHRVGSLAKLQGGKPLSANIDGTRVAVFMVEGEPIATTGKCPHAGGPLFAGELCGATITCSWHGWSFDLKTGECEEDPEMILPFYPVAIEGDEVFVEL